MRLSARRPAPMLTSHATCTPQTLAHRAHTPSHLLIALLLPPSQLAIGDMLIALRESRAPLYSSSSSFSSSTSPPPPQPRPPRRVRVAAEDNHYHICSNPSAHQQALVWVERLASRNKVQCSSSAGGWAEGGRAKGRK